MLKSFLEYIFESESKLSLPIYYSKRLRDFFYKIETSSKDPDVARLASAIRFSENSNQMSSDVTLIESIPSLIRNWQNSIDDET